MEHLKERPRKKNATLVAAEDFADGSSTLNYGSGVKTYVSDG